MDDDDFRYWSRRAQRKARAGHVAACPAAADAHGTLAALCMRRTMAGLRDTLVAYDGGTGQG